MHHCHTNRSVRTDEINSILVSELVLPPLNFKIAKRWLGDLCLRDDLVQVSVSLGFDLTNPERRLLLPQHVSTLISSAHRRMGKVSSWRDPWWFFRVSWNSRQLRIWFNSCFAWYPSIGRFRQGIELYTVHEDRIFPSRLVSIQVSSYSVMRQDRGPLLLEETPPLPESCRRKLVFHFSDLVHILIFLH